MLIGVLHAFASYVAVCVCDFKSFSIPLCVYANRNNDG